MLSLDSLSSLISHCMVRDQRRLRQWAMALRESLRAGRNMEAQLHRLQEQISHSQRERAHRQSQLPPITFPDDLPVVQRRVDIAQAILKNQVVVLCGETGSGKTTQLPKICLELGRGVAGFIGHTQPRRLAARAVAARIADELNTPLGQAVGYKVRFNESLKPSSFIKLMTDGILLAETQGDRLLEQYDTLIIDEAHERSLNIDFLLGYLKQLLPQRPDLKLIITSATIDPQRFSKHFNNAPIIEVSGRTYPVEVRYRPVLIEEEDDEETPGILDAIAQAVDELSADPGDILIFLSGEREIRETAEMLRQRHLRNTEILPLYARLSNDEQNKIFQLRRTGRRIVLSTNVAETSLTVPGIKYVIDPGLARVSRYSARTKVQRLPIERISQASANQRKGRCGRVAAGVCIRLYSEEDFTSRSLFTEPEILRTNLASVILQMKSLRLGPVEEFPFIEPPDGRMIRDGYQTLHELGAVMLTEPAKSAAENRLEPLAQDTPQPPSPPAAPMMPVLRDFALAPRRAEQPKTLPTPPPSAAPTPTPPLDNVAPERFELTPLGKDLARLPTDPRIGRMILAALGEGCLRQVLIIAAALSVQDPRERPMDAQAAADEAHKEFRDDASDFLSFLKLWAFYHDHAQQLSTNQLRKFCKARFISPTRMREWIDIHRQLEETVEELGFSLKRPVIKGRGTPKKSKPHEETNHESPETVAAEAIHRALLTGLLSNIGQKSEGHEYLGTRGRKFNIFPGSALFKQKPQWIIAAEIVETTRVYARTVGPIRPTWIENIAPHLVHYHYTELRWNPLTAHVEADERVTLLGLVIIPQRVVHYGPINPQASREIFLRSALVEEDLRSPPPFLRENKNLIHDIHLVEAKVRRHDLLLDSTARLAFYDARIPQNINSGPTFDRWRRDAEKQNPSLLKMKPEDIIRPGVEFPTSADYPDELPFGDSRLPLSYKFDPGAPDDGITLTVPLTLLSQLTPDRFEWLIPGLLLDKISALIRSLPTATRKNLVPVPQFARNAYEAFIAAGTHIAQDAPSLLAALSNHFLALSDIQIPRHEWRIDTLPEYLNMHFKIVDERNHVLATGRDLIALQHRLVPQVIGAFVKLEHPAYTRDHITTWEKSFDNLPERIELKRHGMTLFGYPALMPAEMVDASIRFDGAYATPSPLVDVSAPKSRHAPLANPHFHSAKSPTDPNAPPIHASPNTHPSYPPVSLRLLDSPESARVAMREGLIRLFILSLGTDLRHLAHNFPEKDRIYIHYALIGTPHELRNNLLHAIVERTFLQADPDIRSKQEFDRRREEYRSRLVATADEMAALVRQILETYHAISLELERPAPADWTAPLFDIKEQLAFLMPRHFVAATPHEWLIHFPRYLRAVQVRMQKLAQGNIARDERHAREIEIAWQTYLHRQEKHTALHIHDPELTRYRWMIEELRVSLFAQELSTSLPVSVRRLEKQLTLVRA